MPSNRQEFAEYCLRDLGAPVLEINVADEQLEDRIDEALEFWRQYHHEGIEKIYLKTQIRATKFVINRPATDFETNSYVINPANGHRFKIVNPVNTDLSDTSVLWVVNWEADSIDQGDTIQAENDEGLTATVSSVTPGEFDLKYLEVSDLVYGVTRLLPFAGTNTSKSMFDLQYQLRLNDLYDLASTSVIYYKQVMGHLSLLDHVLNGKPMFDFNRLQNRIHPRINWDADINPGEYMVAECYRALDPNVFTRVWNESWFKHYATALIKRQWATNLKKFGGLQLPGGVVLDGQSMYAEAIQEIKDLEESLMNKSAPLEFFMG